MRKRVFLIFASVIALSIFSVLWFIQTPYFAGVAKRVAAAYIPADLGIDGDFSEFTIKLFPPGISLNNPQLSVREKNALNLPAGSSVHAERIELNFRPFQMFSGSIRVHRAVIVNGEAKLFLDPEAPARRRSRPLGFRWDELVNIRADEVALENTRLAIEVKKENIAFQVLARTLRLSQGSSATEQDAPAYQLSVDLTEISGRFPKGWPAPTAMPDVRAYAQVSERGVKVERLQALFSSGLVVDSSGSIRGDLLNPKSLQLDAELKVKGTLSQALSFLPPEKTPDAEGSFSFDGRLAGNLVPPAENFRVSGKLTLENGHYEKWRFDHSQVEASWLPNKDGGVISIAGGLISAEESERNSSEKAAHGGKIEVEAFQFRPSSHDPVSIPLKLYNAHIHWLAAPEIKSIFPLQFRASGGATLTITPKAEHDWRIHAMTDLEIRNLQLDNQRLGEARPLHTVLAVPRIGLAGSFEIDRRGVYPGDITATLPDSQLKLGGKINFASGYDLLASGQVNLADMGHIAEIPIRGKGNLSVRVHGPSDALILDFDADIQDAHYLGLDLGSLKGRISWDDEPENLLFSAVQLKKGETSYFGNGAIHVGVSDSINLDFRFSRGTIQDLSSIFDNLTSDLAWFPRALRGSVNGNVKISGGLNMDKLHVHAAIDGKDWDFYGESFRKIRATGGYDRGTYLISAFEVLKKSGTISGNIAYTKDQRFDWKVTTDHLNALDLDHFARLDVPIRGKINIRSEGSGPASSLRSETHASLTGFSVRGVPMASSELRMKSEADALHVTATALGGQGALELVYGFRPGTLSFFRARLQHMDFSPLLLLLNPKLASDRTLAGFVSGSANISFRSGEGDRGSGIVEVSEYILSKSDASFHLVRPVSAKVSEGSFALTGLSLRGPNGEASIDLRSNGLRLEGLISGDIDMSLLEFLVSPVAKASGIARLDFAIGGALKEPTVFGRAHMDGASMRVEGLDAIIENITGALHLKQSTITLHDLAADMAGGRLTAGGSVELFADRFPQLNLRANLLGNRLRFFPFQFAKIQGGLTVTGDTIPYLVEGDIYIDSALSTEKVMAQKPVEGLKAARYMPPPGSRIESNYPKFRLNIKARADRGVLIQNELFDAEAKGTFTVVNTIETPRILGTAELVQGKLNFKNRSFQIHSAKANFDNPTVINPLFELIATTDVNNAKIQLFASGRLDKWKIDLSSNPVMPESEILSLLALGLSSSDVRRLGSADRTVFEQGEGLSLLLHSLDFNREVQNKTGFQIQLGDAVDTQIGSSIARPQVQTDSIAAPKIIIKRQDFLIKNLDLSAGSTLGIGENSRKEVNAEYRLSPGLSILGVWDQRETSDATDKTSYGADFKLQRRFR